MKGSGQRSWHDLIRVIGSLKYQHDREQKPGWPGGQSWTKEKTKKQADMIKDRGWAYLFVAKQLFQGSKSTLGKI